MARRSQCSSAGDNPLDPNYLSPHYREEYRLAIDALVEEDLEGYYEFLQRADVVDFLSTTEVEYIQSSLQVPQQSGYPDRPFQEPGGDGSSDTYWPIHSDLEAPGLDLGWPQLFNFGGPTEVTTLVNPPEPDMPSIKEQARRLIKNAQQVIAIVMDMFTDVDMFADILSAAKRNVAVYILLDEQNAHHFINMVSNCRVNLQNIPYVRVRTVSGITYHCRSGKSFKGQMIDRFLLTDCRAVLSGNYSFMWSFEKLHRCMAHLFFGQLVSTFDEEFRILYAQSLPLIPENVLLPTEEFGLSQKRQFPSKRTSLLREPRKFLPRDSAHSEEWARHSHDEHIDADWRMMPLKKQESFHGPGDIYSRIPSQQSQMDPHFDQGLYRLPLMDNTVSKRHSYADGVPGRYSYPFLQQQGLREFETRGRQPHRGQQPNLGPGPEVEYSGLDKHWSQDYQSADQHSEPGLPQEMEPPEFDPVLNYLSSTRNVDFDQGSGQLQPPANLPFRRFSAGQAYTCQTTITPPNPAEEKSLLQEPLPDRRDPTVKRGLRNWRINSYLSGFELPGDEVLSQTPPQVFEPFEEPSKSTLQPAPGIDFPISKIPNVREFKVPAIPRVSMMPSYSKTATQEQPKKSLEERIGVLAVTKVTPSPSESSSTTECDKPEEEEQKEPSGLRRDDSFRRKYNVPIQRGSRLRSSLIFSSMDQDTKPAVGQKDEETDQNENEQTKLPFVAQVLGQRRATAREPFEWSRYKKSATVDDSALESTKPDVGPSKAQQKDSMTEDNVSPSFTQSKPPVQPQNSLLASPLSVDMSNADNRLMFFKELAAKRKAAQVAKNEKSTENDAMRRGESAPNENSENKADTSVKNPHGSYESLVGQNGAPGDLEETQSTDMCVDGSEKNNKENQVKNNPGTSLSYGNEKTSISTDTEKIELRDSQSMASLPVSSMTEALPVDLPEELNLPKPAITELHPRQPSASKEETPGKDLSHGTEKGSTLECTVDYRSFTSSSLTLTPSSPSAPLNSTHQKEESSKTHNTTQLSILSSLPPSDLNAPTNDAELHTNQSPPDSSSILRQVSSSLISEDPSPTPDSGIFPQAFDKLEPQESVSSSPTTEETSNKQTTSSVMLSDSSQTHLESSTLPEMSAAVNSDQDSPGTKLIKSPLQSKEFSLSDPQNCGSDINSVHSPIAEESHMASPVCASPQSAIADSTPLRPSFLPLHTCLPNKKQSSLELEKEESATTGPTPADSLPKDSKPCSLDIPDVPSYTPSDTIASQDAPAQRNPSDHILTGSGAPLPSETGSCSPSVESIMSSKAENTEATLTMPQTTLDSSSSPSGPPLDSNEALTQTSAESPSSPTEPTSAGLPYITPQSETSESHISKSPTPTDNNAGKHAEENTETIVREACENKNEDSEGSVRAGKAVVQGSVSSDKANDLAGQVNCSKPGEINADEVAPQSKQPKSSQARCHSSTAKVLSSSNLRDDTKLLLEQISANSQTRIESPKESPVTDDEKEDKADKNAQREKEKGIRSQSRGQPRSDEERAVLLERLESMRKGRKVYSRFEMAP